MRALIQINRTSSLQIWRNMIINFYSNLEKPDWYQEKLNYIESELDVLDKQKGNEQ